jgi:hypothetical protein
VCSRSVHFATRSVREDTRSVHFSALPDNLPDRIVRFSLPESLVRDQPLSVSNPEEAMRQSEYATAGCGLTLLLLLPAYQAASLLNREIY